MNIPDNLEYTEDHEWIRFDADVAYIGVTDFAQGELGDIVYVEVETVGDEISSGEIFGTVEAVKTVSDLFMPVSGEVLEFNEQIESNPELINNDPYISRNVMFGVKYTLDWYLTSLLTLGQCVLLSTRSVTYYLQPLCLQYKYALIYKLH